MLVASVERSTVSGWLALASALLLTVPSAATSVTGVAPTMTSSVAPAKLEPMTIDEVVVATVCEGRHKQTSDEHVCRLIVTRARQGAAQRASLRAKSACARW